MFIIQIGQVDDQAVHEFRLKGADGTEAAILDYGAILRDLVVPVRGGERRRVVLGFRSLAGYVQDTESVGVTVGRCINRIDRGFTLDGRQYSLPINEGDHVHLHGGPRSYSKRVWTHRPADTSGDDGAAATFELVSPDGDNGYPGQVTARCRYEIAGPGTLRITLTATTDAPTIVNLGHHSYFSLQPGSDVRDHRMMVAADFYTPLDPHLIPTGEIRSVTGTPFDFRKDRPIRANVAGGYDLNFVLNQGWLRSAESLPVAARVVSPSGDLAMEVATTEPGLQFYEGIHLKPSAESYEGEPHLPHRGLCLEPQRFPDAINRPHFGEVVLRPGETYRQVSQFRFFSPLG